MYGPGGIAPSLATAELKILNRVIIVFGPDVKTLEFVDHDVGVDEIDSCICRQWDAALRALEGRGTSRSAVAKPLTVSDI